MGIINENSLKTAHENLYKTSYNVCSVYLFGVLIGKLGDF